MAGKLITVLTNESLFHGAEFGVSVAKALSELAVDKNIAVLDSYIESGQFLPSVLNQQFQKNMSGVQHYLGRLTPALLKGYLSRYSDNMDVAVTLNEIEEKKLLTPMKYSLLLKLLTDAYDTSFVLSDYEINPYTTEALDASALVLFLVNNNLGSLSNFNHYVNRMRELKHFTGKIQIVLSYSGDNGLTEQMVKDYTGINVLGKIHVQDTVLVERVNMRRPLLTPRNSLFVKDVFFLAKILLKESEKLAKDEKSIFFPPDENTAVKSVQEVSTSAEVQDNIGQDIIFDLKKKINDMLYEELSAAGIDFNNNSPENRKELVNKTRRTIENLLINENTGLDKDTKEQVVQEILDNVLGFGPLEKYLREEKITEIMVNGPDSVYIEKGGKLEFTGDRFASSQQLMTVIERIVMPLGRRIDESSPIVDARLPDGSRVNAIIKPLSLVGPVLTIRKFSQKKLGFDDLIKFGSATEAMGKFLDICVKLRKNIVVSGGTGSGKTTMLNIISSFIPSDERIVTIEDSAELKLPQKHVVSLETRPANIEGEGEIGIRRLVINALRMRPDRIVVGETRGAEALDMLQAMNTGHDGSATTVHSNSPTDSIGRLVTLVMYAGMDLPEKAILEQIASAVHIIIQASRLSDGSRKTTYISEVQGLENGKVKIVDIFRFEQTGINDKGKVEGKFVATGAIPSFWNEVAIHGYDDDKKIFKTS